MREVVVLGVGMVKFGRYPDKPVSSLAEDACARALRDSGVPWNDVEVAYCGHVVQGTTAGQKALGRLGLTGIPIMNVENACATGSSAFREAYMVIAGGFYDVAVAVGFEKMGRGMLRIPGGVSSADRPYVDMGLGAMPSMFALIGRELMNEHGVTPEQFAKVSVKNHKNSVYNPFSQYQKEFTLEEVLQSRMICDPLTLYQCCPTGDGAAAAVLCSRERATKYASKQPITIAASALKSDTHSSPRTEGEDITVRASKAAYEIAGIGPEDLDMVELHDCFSVAELWHYPHLGLCEEGEAGKMIEEGETDISGKIPVNPSGGLLSRGHPLGATGLAQVAEAVWQLRGEAGKRQINDPKVALTHTMGLGGATAVHILKK